MLLPSALRERHGGAPILASWEGDVLEAGSSGLFTPGSPGLIQE